MAAKQCVGFLRQLGDHVAVRSSGEMPAHAGECPGCARHLELASLLAAELRCRPAIPAALRADSFLESIHERILADVEGSPMGLALGRALSVEAPGDQIPWPLQSGSAVVEGALRQRSRRVPVWLWAKIHKQLGDATRPSVRSNGRAVRIAAAAAVLMVLLGWKFGAGDGTSRNPRIVFVQVAEVPPIFYPTAVLRHGADR